MNQQLKLKEDKNIILSGVRALCGAVVPSLRSVSMELRDNRIIWQCIFDENADKDDLELLAAAAAEVIADFPDFGLDEIIKQVPHSQKMDHLRNLIFLRRE